MQLVRRMTLLLLSCVLVPTLCQAAVRSVVLYPASATVTETAKLTTSQSSTGLSQIFLQLPPAADPSTLTLTLADTGLSVVDIGWERILDADSKEVLELRSLLEKTEAERDELKARQDSANGRIDFWQRLRLENSPKPAEAMAMSEAMGKDLTALHVRRSRIGVELEEIEKRIAQLRQRLQQLTGPENRVWSVSVLVADADSRDVEATYAYQLRHSGWTPAYRVEADPASSRVRLAFEADIIQRSGSDWTGAEISLATVAPRSPITPPGLPDWIIAPRPQLRPAPLQARKMAREEIADKALMESELGAAPPPVAEHKTTFTLWRLGVRPVPAGKPVRVSVAEHSLAADFTHLARPGVSAAAFLRAEVTSDQPLDLPQGEAVISLDGAVLGKRPFAFSGTKQDLYFGTDPLVEVDSRLVEKKTGEKGLLSRSQTALWRWEVTLKNTRKRPVRVRLEEPRPQARDQRIELDVKARPKPLPAESTETPEALVWLLDIPPSTEKIVSWSVSLTAPDDMELDLGWR